METGFGRKYGPYAVLVTGIIMCLMGAYLMITEEDSTGIVIGGGGVLFIGVSAALRKKTSDRRLHLNCLSIKREKKFFLPCIK